jgi:hypothetical protein
MPTKRTRGYLGWKRDLPDPRDHKFSVARLTLQTLYPDSAEIRKNRLPTAVEAILLDR